MEPEEIILTLLIILVIYAVVRWLTRPRSPASASGTSSLPGVTPSMVQTVTGAFPHIRAEAIVYSLSKTKSAQATSERILEQGYLPDPPASFHIPPSLLPASTVPPTSASAGASLKSSLPTPQRSLIDRFDLSARLPSSPPSPGSAADSSPPHTTQPAVVGKEEAWAKSKEERERGLRERKERMILAARQKMLDKQAQTQPQVAGPAI